MSVARVALLAAAAVAALFAVAGFVLWHEALWLVFGFEAAVLVALVLLERGRYRKQVDRSRTTWQRTGERFFDPTTGAATDVYYDPVTGDRDYRSGSAASR